MVSIASQEPRRKRQPPTQHHHTTCTVHVASGTKYRTRILRSWTYGVCVWDVRLEAKPSQTRTRTRAQGRLRPIFSNRYYVPPPQPPRRTSERPSCLRKISPPNEIGKAHKYQQQQQLAADLVRHDVPNPVARHNEELVLRGPWETPRLRRRRNLALFRREVIVLVLEVPQSARLDQPKRCGSKHKAVRDQSTTRKGSGILRKLNFFTRATTYNSAALLVL